MSACNGNSYIMNCSTNDTTIHIRRGHSNPSMIVTSSSDSEMHVMALPYLYRNRKWLKYFLKIGTVFEFQKPDFHPAVMVAASYDRLRLHFGQKGFNRTGELLEIKDERGTKLKISGHSFSYTTEDRIKWKDHIPVYAVPHNRFTCIL